VIIPKIGSLAGYAAGPAIRVVIDDQDLPWVNVQNLVTAAEN
jgi:hypothetical protein